METNKEITYSTILPLIGGQVFGAKLVLNKYPEYILSYPGFIGNDRLLLDYLKQQNQNIPYHVIDNETGKLDVNLKYVDFVSCLAPCSALSQLNNGKKRGADAPQNEWMYKSAKFVLGTIKPRAMIGENAPGLFGPVGEPVLMNLKQIGKDNGYSMSIVKTSTILHGIPQKRPRTFYFFWNTTTAPILEWISTDTPSYESYLSKYTELNKDEILAKTSELQNNPLYIWFKKEYTDWRTWMKNQGGSFMSALISSGKADDYINWVKKEYPEHAKFAERANEKRKLGQGFWDSSPFLPTESAGAFTGARMNAVHPTEERVLTRGELMYLMGLPSDMQTVNECEMGKVFQNVPSVTSAAWQGQVIKFLKGQLEISDVSFIKQDNLTQRIEKEKNSKQLF